MNDFQQFLQPSSSHILILSACTAKKKYSPVDQLSADDLDDEQRRRTGETRLSRYQLSAAEMYTGGGHQFVRQAVDTLREHEYDVTHYILSAGYGWLNERDVIAPYNVTFAKKSTTWVKERGRRLELQKRLIEIASEYQRVVLVLGREYLEAIGLPLPIEALPPTLAYIAPSVVRRLGDGIGFIRVGPAEQREIGAHWSSAKEKRFLVDVYGVRQTKDN